jgi:Ser/Thr protein kinase RdoA (MazF antagonist)
MSFVALMPDRVLDFVEGEGLRSTGRCYALNSLENRVYDAELEDGSHVIAKFYRPGRWSRETILDEHRLLHALLAAEIPVAAPLTTLREHEGIFCALFPRVGGRDPGDFTPERLRQLGRLLARVHNVAATLDLQHRPTLSADTYGRDALAKLVGAPARLLATAEAFLERARPRLAGQCSILCHADFHRGNILARDAAWTLLDFDDCAFAPAVQDFWLVLPARAADAPLELEALLCGYEQFRSFDRSEVELIEVLRGLRYLRYAGWIAERWRDPAFSRAFPDFGGERYFAQLTEDVATQLELL